MTSISSSRMRTWITQFNLQTTPCLHLAFVRNHQMAPPRTVMTTSIWRTLGRIQWHVIPELRITLQGAATWCIHCHDSRATCHTVGSSHLAKSMSSSCHITGYKNSIRHIKNCFSPYLFFFVFNAV